jgi:hypothetical protein
VGPEARFRARLTDNIPAVQSDACVHERSLQCCLMFVGHLSSLNREDRP